MRSIKDYVDSHFDSKIHSHIKVSPEGYAKLIEELDVNPIETNLKTYKNIIIKVSSNQKENVRLCKIR